MANSCIYNGTAYSNGAELCIDGKKNICDDGNWRPTRFDCPQPSSAASKRYFPMIAGAIGGFIAGGAFVFLLTGNQIPPVTDRVYLTATPPLFGYIRDSHGTSPSTPDASITITNKESVPMIIESVELEGLAETTLAINGSCVHTAGSFTIKPGETCLISFAVTPATGLKPVGYSAIDNLIIWGHLTSTSKIYSLADIPVSYDVKE